MTLTSAFRISQMRYSDLSFMVKSEVAYIFPLHKLYKTWRKGKAPPSKYLKDQELCVVSALNKYLKCTKSWSKNGDKFQLLLTYTIPCVEVHSSAVSRSMKEILKETGVDLDVFKCLTTRSASTSKVCLLENSVDDIIIHGSCRNESITYPKDSK